MAPSSYHSSNSSLEALNGSAATSQSMYQTDPPSYSAPANRTNHANLARYPSGAPQGNGTSNNTSANGNHAGFAQYRHENGSYASTGQSRVPTAYATSYHSTESEYANQPYSNHTGYRPSTPSYAVNPVYASTLSIEDQDEQNAAANDQYSTGEGPESEETYSSDYHRSQNGSTASRQHSHQMSRWSRENAPEERIRLALPRWESEQHRIEYERSQEPPRRPRERSQRREPRRRGDRSQ